MRNSASVIVLLALIGMFSCRTGYRTVTDTVTTVQTVHDTVLKFTLVPYSDSVTVDDSSSHLKDPYAESWAIYRNGKLTHSLRILTDTITVPASFRETSSTKMKEVPVEIERQLTKWEKIKMEYGGWAIGVSCGFLIVLIGYLFFIFRKRFL